MHASCVLTRATVPLHLGLKSWSVARDCDITMLFAVDWSLVCDCGISWSYSLFTCVFDSCESVIVYTQVQPAYCNLDKLPAAVQPNIPQSI